MSEVAALRVDRRGRVMEWERASESEGAYPGERVEDDTGVPDDETGGMRLGRQVRGQGGGAADLARW